MAAGPAGAGHRSSEHGRGGQLVSLSCASPGNCAAGGYGKLGGFVINEVDGRWLPAQLVTGLPRFAAVTSVSCAAPGDCAAGGTYADPVGHGQAFVVDEVSGRWRPAELVAGIAALNSGHRATVSFISCSAPGNCSAAGSYSPMPYQNGSSYDVPFVVSQQVPGLTALGPAAGVFGISCSAPGRCTEVDIGHRRHTTQAAFAVSQDTPARPPP